MATTTALAGYGGSITGITGATEILEWTVDREVNAAEATSMSSGGNRERIPCLKRAAGNFNSIVPASAVGSYSTVTFKNSNAGFNISGNIICTKITPTTPVDNICTYNHEFIFTGAFTAAAS